MRPALYTLCGVAVLLCLLDFAPLVNAAYDVAQSTDNLRNFIVCVLAAAALSGGFRS